MAKLVFANLEQVETCSADSMVLYFEGAPTDSDVVEALDKVRDLKLSVDPEDPDFGWSLEPSEVSDRARLSRVVAWPSG